MYFFSKLLSALCFISLISSINSSENRHNDDNKIIEGYEARRPVIRKVTVGFNDQAVDLRDNVPVELMNKRYCHFDHNTIIEHAETKKITVLTTCNMSSLVQLETKRILVNEGDTIIAPYKIVVYPGGVISLGFLNAERNAYYGELLVLRAGTHKGTYWKNIPAGGTEISLDFNNHNTDKHGSSAFTIEYIGLHKRRI